MTIKKPAQSDRFLEAPPRFELGIRVLQTHALPLGYSAGRLYFCEIASISYKSKNFAPTIARAMERITRLELATSTLARWRSTR